MQRTKLDKMFRDPFGNIILLKRILMCLIGFITYRSLNMVNKMEVEGMDYLKDLPKGNVLFVSNHHTYFADVFALYHVFCAAKWNFKNINFPVYLFAPRVRSYFIAAEETMKNDGWLPKVFSYTGAVTIKRTWRHQGQEVQRSSDFRAPAKIKKALDYGWVITFPQGTTTPNAKVRKGTASLIKALKPIIVPVEIDGFRTAFDKKGLKVKKKGTKLSVKIKKPIHFQADVSAAEIQEFLEGHLVNLP